MKTLINWKVFFILWIAAILATIAVIPYTLELQSSVLASLSISLPALVAAQLAQSAVLFAVMISVGMLLARRVGLGAPIVEAATRGEPITDRMRSILPVSILIGIMGALVIIGLEVLVFQPAMLSELGDAAEALNLQDAQPAAWKGFLASFYGGIAEEIQLRLFMMTLFVWLGRFISKTIDGKPTAGVFWVAAFLAAILFGLGHLPATASLISLTPLVITRAVVLNGLLGVAFGWLYWKHGLEAAIVSHFAADIVLHVILAL